jgi:ribonuclease T1
MRAVALALFFACGAVLAFSGDLRVAELPPEARQTITLIRQGGQFPYARDGAIFSNREGQLPKQKRGYYHEYTVKTPGARDRGARRIVAGEGGELYYTEDHYRSFRRVIE